MAIGDVGEFSSLALGNNVNDPSDRARLFYAGAKQLSTDGALAIDRENINDGSLNSGLTFGSATVGESVIASGEGIASKRTADGNQNGLDFYTASTPRLSITNTGNVGIGTTTLPTEKLEVAGKIKTTELDATGTVKALAFQGDGSALTGKVSTSGDTVTGPLTIHNHLTVSGNIGTTGNLSVTGMITASNVSLAPTNEKRGALFLGTVGDFNYVLYNNLSNIDNEGTWDGAKWNIGGGLNLRVGFGTSKSSALYIDNVGKIGISTSQPNKQLSVKGEVETSFEGVYFGSTRSTTVVNANVLTQVAAAQAQATKAQAERLQAARARQIAAARLLTLRVKFVQAQTLVTSAISIAQAALPLAQQALAIATQAQGIPPQLAQPLIAQASSTLQAAVGAVSAAQTQVGQAAKVVSLSTAQAQAIQAAQTQVQQAQAQAQLAIQTQALPQLQLAASKTVEAASQILQVAPQIVQAAQQSVQVAQAEQKQAIQALAQAAQTAQTALSAPLLEIYAYGVGSRQQDAIVYDTYSLHRWRVRGIDRMQLDSKGFLSLIGDSGMDNLVVPTGVENLFVIRGTIKADGTILAGKGFTVLNPGAGLYHIIFNSLFADTPTVIVTQQFPDDNDELGNGGSTLDNAVVVSVSASGCRIKCGKGDGTAENRRFHFIASGLRE